MLNYKFRTMITLCVFVTVCKPAICQTDRSRPPIVAKFEIGNYLYSNDSICYLTLFDSLVSLTPDTYWLDRYDSVWRFGVPAVYTYVWKNQTNDSIKFIVDKKVSGSYNAGDEQLKNPYFTKIINIEARSEIMFRFWRKYYEPEIPAKDLKQGFKREIFWIPRYDKGGLWGKQYINFFWIAKNKYAFFYIR